MTINFSSLKKVSLSVICASFLVASTNADVAIVTDAPVSRLVALKTSVSNNVQNACTAISNKTKAAANSVVSTVQYPYVQYPVLTTVALTAAVTVALCKFINYRINKNIIQAINPDDVSKQFVASLINDRNNAMSQRDTILVTVQARGFATPAEDADLANLQNSIATTESYLATVLRSQKSFTDLIKIAISANLA